MENSELVSVIMPAFNAEKFISESIKSVIGQTYFNWELIIIDDGSKDNTKEIVFNFQTSEPRIKYIYQQNGKQGKARNTGIENARGDLIAFQDADDIWVPGFLEEQVRLLKQTHADLVFSQIKYIDKESNLLDDFHGVPYTTYEGDHGIYEMIKGNCIPIITVLALKDSILKAGAFKISDELQYGEDYDLWLRMLLKNAKLVCHPEPLAFYRKHEMQSSKLTPTKYLQLLAIINDLPVKHLESEKKQAMRLWLKRSMRYPGSIGYTTIRKLIRFIPSNKARNISMLASYCLPPYLLRKLVTLASDLK